MKIYEVTNRPQSYLATVRVVLHGGSTTARTTITADTLQQARMLMTRIYGDGSVLNISEVMRESPQTHQIQRQAAIPPQAAQTRAQPRKNAQIQSSSVAEAIKTLSPQELQVKSFADKAEGYKQQAKAMKARQQMAKAQQNLIKVQRNGQS